jgi:transmembrane sensor
VNEKEKYQSILKQLQVPEGKTTNEAWEDLSIQLNNVKPTHTLRRWWPYAAAAASVALVLGLVFWKHSNIGSFSAVAKPGEHKQVTLPDGSVAELNAGSTIEWKANREVRLQGEAFFHVKKGSRFVVYTTHGQVEVLGTEFNVREYNGHLTVHCAAGRVAVMMANDRAELLPGMKAQQTESGWKLSGYSTASADWRSDTHEFVDRPLTEVFEEMERQFNVHIQVSGIEGRIFTGAFSGKDLKTTLDQVCLPMSLTHSIDSAMTVSVTTLFK